MTESSGLYITFSTWEGWEYDGAIRMPWFPSSCLRPESWSSHGMLKHIWEASNLWYAWWSICMGSLRTRTIALWRLTVHLWVGTLPSPHSSRPEIKDRRGRNARRLLVSFQSYLDIVNSFIARAESNPYRSCHFRRCGRRWARDSEDELEESIGHLEIEKAERMMQQWRNNSNAKYYKMNKKVRKCLPRKK